MIHRIDVLAREWADPHVASDHELARLLDPPAPWARVVVLGDSVAEGVREPTPGYRDLGWADRLGAAFALARPGAVLANLGRRHLTAAEVRAAQLTPAVAGPMSTRLGELVDVTRAVGAEVGGIHVRLRDHPAATDTDIYARDGLHLDARGHAIVTTALARHLGVARRE
jgi:lysophospholipase L1-like esterase